MQLLNTAECQGSAAFVCFVEVPGTMRSRHHLGLKYERVRQEPHVDDKITLPGHELGASAQVTGGHIQ